MLSNNNLLHPIKNLGIYIIFYLFNAHKYFYNRKRERERGYRMLTDVFKAQRKRIDHKMRFTGDISPAFRLTYILFFLPLSVGDHR